ncbi:MAG TPA: hypothetical protein DIT54_02850 [Lachnospiraceae bacterium]|nr:hypothetical protein [Lachnospiraceae bacterium]HIS63190.1 DUF4405 domain-containing protein [Candidatus Scybalomonas excrementigallinarum]
MTKKSKIKIVVDMLMTIALLFLMPYGMVGETVHEWIGMGIFVLFLFHHILNRKWMENLLKGKYTLMRTIQAILVAMVLVFMLGSMISGFILSRYIFTFLNIKGLSSIASTVHMICGYWGFICMSLHLGVHWSMMMKMVRRIFPKSSVLRKEIARATALVIAGYGLYAFIKRDIGSYMLLKVHFVFFDYKEPLIFFLLDYMAVMGLFVLIGHYVSEVLKNREDFLKKEKMRR